jgi:hypothetical protein
MDVEGIGEAHEEIEKRPVVDRFGNLRVPPAGVAQSLDLLVGDAIGVPRQGFDELQQQPVLGRETGGVEVSVAQRGGGLRILLTLQLQEPGMAAESIVATIERGDIGRDHLVLSPTERAIREVQPAGLVYGAQKVGT